MKGPIGFLIPGLVLFVFHRFEGRRGVGKRFFAPLNLLVFLGVPLPLPGFCRQAMKSLARPVGLSIQDAEALDRHFVTPMILLPVCALLGLLARFRRDVGLCFVSFAIFPPLLFNLNFGAIEVVFSVKSARQLAQQIGIRTPATLELLSEHCRHQADHARALWALIVLSECLDWAAKETV